MIQIEHLARSFAAPRSSRAAGLVLTAQAAWPGSLCSCGARCQPGRGQWADHRLVGSNGAGKTTTLRMLAGLITPDAGRMRVDGIDVALQPQAAVARMGVLSDARGLYPRLSARENIVYFGRLQGMSRDAAQARAEALARMLDMWPLLERRTDGFSQGERMKTALARALVHDPANIVLDEPTNGLDVLATRALRESLRFLRTPEGGAKCVIFSSHIMQEVQRLCDHVVVVAQGCSVASGSVSELLQRTGETDFEEAFVKLAFSRSRPTPPPEPPHDTLAQGLEPCSPRNCSMPCATGVPCWWCWRPAYCWGRWCCWPCRVLLPRWKPRLNSARWWWQGWAPRADFLSEEFF